MFDRMIGGEGMRLEENALHHLIFLAEVVLEGRKKGLMEETLQCLIYIAKSVEYVDLPEGVIEQLNQLMSAIEADLRIENERMQEIQSHMNQLNKRRPPGM